MKQLWFLVILLLFGCAQSESKLTIATAANMQYAMKELVKSFEAESNIKTDLVISSSGKLTAQISAGAPYDLFFSADANYPQTLSDQGLTTDEPKIYAYGQLVLWSNSPNLVVNIQDLVNANRIAIGNPKTAPYGKAAMEVLHVLALEESLTEKLIYGESISQVNQFVTTQNVNVGFTSKSSVIANPTGNWISIPDSLHKPIAQSMAIVKNDRGNNNSAKSFTEFVLSDKGQQIIRKYGYK